MAALGALGGSVACGTSGGSSGSSPTCENRTVPVNRGAFSDTFAANAVHLYAIDLSTVSCP
jgi:hypothetical protein